MNEATMQGDQSKEFAHPVHGANEKPSHGAQILQWLSENYEIKAESKLPRSLLYTHYLDFCKRIQATPYQPATFGKILRQKFPKLTTRRLGHRGQSKYHYFHLAIKEFSVYNTKVNNGKVLTRFTLGTNRIKKLQRKKSSSQERYTLILPPFPTIKINSTSCPFDQSKLDTFMIMYRAHSQRILDSVISTKFSEVEIFLLHFWHRLPEHITSVLRSEIICNMVAVCDVVLYKTLTDVFLPSSIELMPESLVQETKEFSRNFLPWLEICLINVPEELSMQKLKVAKSFIGILQRQLSFLNLAQALRTVLSSSETIAGMLQDLQEQELNEIETSVWSWTTENHDKAKEITRSYLNQLGDLLSKQASVEAYTGWVDSFLLEFVIKSNSQGKMLTKWNYGQFLLWWTSLNTRFLHNLTLGNSANFWSFHLLSLALQEYVLLVLDTALMNENEAKMIEGIKRQFHDLGCYFDLPSELQTVQPTIINIKHNDIKRQIGKRKRKRQFLSQDKAIPASFTWNNGSKIINQKRKKFIGNKNNISHHTVYPGPSPLSHFNFPIENDFFLQSLPSIITNNNYHVNYSNTTLPGHLDTVTENCARTSFVTNGYEMPYGCYGQQMTIMPTDVSLTGLTGHESSNNYFDCNELWGQYPEMVSFQRNLSYN